MEHKIIRGGGEYLPFARSCVAKLKKLGIGYASMSYIVGGATVKVRIVPGHEYIEITGEGYFVSVFPGVQYPETDPERVPQLGIDGATLRTGSFPETTPDAGMFLPQVYGKTRFGGSPYSKRFLRMGRSIATIVDTFPFGVTERWGISAGKSIHNDIYVDGELALSIDSASPYGGHTAYGEAIYEAVGSERSEWAWATNSVRFAPCVNSGSKPVLACLVVSTEDYRYSQVDGYGYDISDTVMFRTEQGQRSAGTSSIRLFWAKKPDEAGVRVVDVAPLPYVRAQYIVFSSVADGAPLVTSIARVDTFEVTNDVETSYLYRRWHATDKVSAAPDGAVFVLRESSGVVQHDRSNHTYPSAPHTITIDVARGYALSFVPPDGTPNNNVATKDIGALGYIDGVFPSADNKKVFVYYGTGAGEVPTGNSAMFAPTAFEEFLDVYSVTRSEDSYSLALTSTINLGPVTLRATSAFIDFGVPETRTDHYASKLHGATLEVNGFIWADRYCYVVAENEFVAIPGFVEFPEPFQHIHHLPHTAKDLITGPEDDRTSYLAVSPDGRSATYVMLKSGTVARYTISKDAVTGVYSVNQGDTTAVAGGYAWTEFPFAKSVWFSRTPPAT